MKKIIVFILLIIPCLVGATYFNDSTNLLSVFKNNKYHTDVIEKSINSSDWLPGSTIDENIYVLNKGNEDVAVRAKVIEEWVSKSGKKLSGFQNDNKAAIINYSSSDWVKIDDYYYYKYKLARGMKTSDFIDSVTFNVEIENESGCIREYGDGKLRVICTSSDSSYAGSSYKLKVVVDTIQYDLYKEKWNIDYNIE